MTDAEWTKLVDNMQDYRRENGLPDITPDKLEKIRNDIIACEDESPIMSMHVAVVRSPHERMD